MASYPVDDQLIADLTVASTLAANRTAWKSFKARAVAIAPAPMPTPTPAPTNLDRLVYCTKAPHEADPHGVPTSYDWQHVPTGIGAKNWNVGKGIDPSSPDGTAIIWMQVYLAADQTLLPQNARVAIRNQRLLTTDGQTWKILQDQGGHGLGGDAYPESFVGSHGIRDVRVEPDGSNSVRLITPGCNYHGWIDGIWPRPAIAPGQTGFIATVEAKLIPHDATKPLDPVVRLVVNCGIDLYAGPTDAAGGNVQGGLGQGRFCLATTSWQTMGFSTLTETQLRALPPPV